MASGEGERGRHDGRMFAFHVHTRYVNGEITREQYYQETNDEIARKRLEVYRHSTSRHAAKVYERGYADGILAYRKDVEGR